MIQKKNNEIKNRTKSNNNTIYKKEQLSSKKK